MMKKSKRKRIKLRKPPNHRKPNAEEIAVIVDRYSEGESLQVLERAFNLSNCTLRNTLEKKGVHLRNRKEASACRDHSNDHGPEYIPSPEEIAEETTALRKAHIVKRLLETERGYERTPSGIRCCSPAPIRQV